MRAHMAALENAPMVSRFHQLEQSVERENLGGVDRFLSFGYKILSNYGSSSGKPLVWLLSLLLVTFFLALFDGGSVPFPCRVSVGSLNVLDARLSLG